MGFSFINTVSRHRLRTKTAILSAFVLVFVSGCSLVHYGIFISTLSEDMTLEVRQLTSSRIFESPERYTLAKTNTKRAVCLIAEVTAMDSSGHVLFRQVLPGFRPEWDRFQKQGERKIYYLVTRDGAYPIPVEWRESWSEHQSEIVEGFDLNAARQRLVREGLLIE